MNRRQFLTRALASVPVVLAGEQLAELSNTAVDSKSTASFQDLIQ